VKERSLETHLVGPDPRDPHLIELRSRYAALRLPLQPANDQQWGSEFCAREIPIDAFRADSAYLWQNRYGYAGPDPAATYRAYADYLRDIDRRSLLDSLREDGAFGCQTFSHHGQLISRDLLDSVNELIFLDRAWNLFSRDRVAVLDIGAGYGRLAYHMSRSVPGLVRYVCVDAIPESTYLCDWYLRYREVPRPPAHVLALDELDELHGTVFDLAINIRSFTEMPYRSVISWLDLIDRLGVPALFVIPNYQGSLRGVGSRREERRDFMPDLLRRGFRLTDDEPVITDSALRRAGWNEHFMLFKR
jgi:SAM-dependent methyltransferase